MWRVLAVAVLMQPAPVNAPIVAGDSAWTERLVTISVPDAPPTTAYLQPSQDLVAVRLAVRVEEDPGAVSGTEAHQALVGDALRRAASRVGGVAETRYDRGVAIYTVVGPAAELEALVSALRDAVAEPAPAFGEAAAAWRVATEATLARLEAPPERLRTELWRRLAFGAQPTRRAALRGPADLADFWRRHFRPDRMRIVVVGGVTANAVRAALAGWPAPGRAPATVAALSPAPPEASPQLSAPWVALALDGRGLDLATLAVAMRSIADGLALPEFRWCSTELWFEGDDAAIVVMGAGALASGRNAPTPAALEQRLRAAIESAANRISASAVETARRKSLAEVLLAIRSPQGLADFLGEFDDRAGGAAEASRFMERLERATAANVYAAMRELLQRPAIAVHIAP